eukprot:1876770-Amphidinium_carterae.1
MFCHSHVMSVQLLDIAASFLPSQKKKALLHCCLFPACVHPRGFLEWTRIPSAISITTISLPNPFTTTRNGISHRCRGSQCGSTRSVGSGGSMPLFRADKAHSEQNSCDPLLKGYKAIVDSVVGITSLEYKLRWRLT